MKETREQRFKRLAEKRTTAVLDRLRILGNLSDRTNYSYSQEDVRKIFSSIESQLRGVKARFQFKGSSKEEFKL